jgi:hypothetical protein
MDNVKYSVRDPLTPSEVAGETLRWINGIRKELGLPRLRRLLKGLPGSSWLCPVARSLAKGLPKGHLVKVTPSYVVIDSPTLQTVGLSYDTIPPVKAFIREFDGGGFQEYKLKRGRKLWW